MLSKEWLKSIQFLDFETEFGIKETRKLLNILKALVVLKLLKALVILEVLEVLKPEDLGDFDKKTWLADNILQSLWML